MGIRQKDHEVVGKSSWRRRLELSLDAWQVKEVPSRPHRQLGSRHVTGLGEQGQKTFCGEGPREAAARWSGLSFSGAQT